MDWNDLIARVLHYHFDALRLFQKVKTVLDLPAQSSVFHQRTGKLSLEFFLSKCPKIGKASVSNCQVYFILEMTNSTASERSAVYSDLPFDANPQLQEVENLFSIFLKVAGLQRTLCSSISSVVPNKNIYVFIQKVFEIICMWIVNHVLICHSVRVAQNESWEVEVG